MVLLLQITERLTDGTGDFDPEALLRRLPEDLALPEKKVASQMRTLAKDRRHTTLVQVRHCAFFVRWYPASPACECSPMLQIACLPKVDAAGSTPVMDMPSARRPFILWACTACCVLRCVVA